MPYLKRTRKSNNWVYRRRVPLDVAAAFGRPWVEQSTGTPDKREAGRRAAMLSAKYELVWDSLRDEGTELNKWVRGSEWLSSLSPLDLDDEGVALAAADTLEGLHTGRVKPPPGVPKEALAAYLQGKPMPSPQVSLKDAVELWVKEHRPSYSPTRGARRVAGQFTDLCGDIPLDQITRQQARRYRDALLKSAMQPNSVVTYLGYLRTVYDHAVREGLIDQRVNPFASLTVPGLKSLEEAVEPIPRAHCLDILATALEPGYDKVDWWSAILLTTGMRPVEAYNAKMVLDAPVPYWDVPRAKKSPRRHIPIHPRLIGKEALPYNVRAEQMRRAFIERHAPYNNYQCRHSFKDEAMRVDMPLELRQKLMGHSGVKTFGAHAIYGSPLADLEAASKYIKQMWVK